MLRADLYEELNKQELALVLCPKKELKEKLQELGEKLNLKEDTLIIQVCETTYQIYYTQRDTPEENVCIQLNLAMRFRMEVDLFELDKEMLRLEQAILQYPFEVITDNYCLVRYMDLSDNFLILDVYVGVERKN